VSIEWPPENVVVNQHVIKTYVTRHSGIYLSYGHPHRLGALNEKLAAAISRYVEEALR
jgi:hypothetical protein